MGETVLALSDSNPSERMIEISAQMKRVAVDRTPRAGWKH